MMARPHPQSGNVLLYILIAIVMIAALTAALRDGGGIVQNVDTEKLDSEARNLIKFSQEMENGVRILLDKGLGEEDIRVAYPGANAADYGTITTNPQNQLFSTQGGQVAYRAFPGLATGAWSIGKGRALPQIGSSKAELVGILTGVTAEACTAINKQIGFTSTPSIACTTVYAPSNSAFPSSPYSLPSTGFTYTPAPRFCVYCSDRADYFYFTTILPR